MTGLLINLDNERGIEMAIHGCGKPIIVYVAKGYDYKPINYNCGNTGVNGYPELCEDCEKEFNSHEYRQHVMECGERIEDDY